MADKCRTLGKRCVFLTQPVLWRTEGVTPEEERLLWFGRVGREDVPRGFVRAEDLAKAMDAYNRTLVQVCHDKGVECFDLAGAVPKSREAFYDDCHFTEKGAEIVASWLAGKLTEAELFAAGRSE